MQNFWISFGIHTGLSALFALLANKDANQRKPYDAALIQLRDDLNAAYPPTTA